MLPRGHDGLRRRRLAAAWRKRRARHIVKEIDVSCFGAHDPRLAKLALAIAQRVGQQRFNVWFDNSTRLGLTQEGLEITVPNEFISEWIGRNFAQPIQEAASEVLGYSPPLRFTVSPQLFGEATVTRGQTGCRAPCGSPGGARKGGNGSDNDASAAVAHIAGDFIGQRIQPSRAPVQLRYNMSGFVTGPSNKLAYEAAERVARNPGAEYNPLFIHGSCGVGKTHLLQALCARFMEHHPAGRWQYLTAEQFTNEFITAMRSHQLDTFRRKFRELNLLVIDDVHFMARKSHTQEEFLHTFNAIEAAGRQIVMASDSHPKLFHDFSEPLINRFVSGMVVRIDPPNYSMRLEILRRLAAGAGLSLPDDALGWIARHVTQNVRELEGAITRVVAHVHVSGRQPDLALVQEALSDVQRHLTEPLKPEHIVAAVCQYFGIEQKDLISSRRHRTLSLARSVAMYLVRKTGRMSFPEIGALLGKRNHSTVISACRRVDRALGCNATFTWTTAVGQRSEEASEVVSRIEELSRTMG